MKVALRMTLLSLCAVCASAPVFSSEKLRVLYVEAVYEPGATPTEAQASYRRDHGTFERICASYGGTSLWPVSDSSLPIDNGDGSWKVQMQACVSGPTPAPTLAFHADGNAAFDAQ